MNQRNSQTNQDEMLKVAVAGFMGATFRTIGANAKGFAKHFKRTVAQEPKRNQLLKTMGTGALYGAGVGTLNSNSDTLGGRAKDAMTGGLIGGALGGAFRLGRTFKPTRPS